MARTPALNLSEVESKHAFKKRWRSEEALGGFWVRLWAGLRSAPPPVLAPPNYYDKLRFSGRSSILLNLLPRPARSLASLTSSRHELLDVPRPVQDRTRRHRPALASTTSTALPPCSPSETLQLQLLNRTPAQQSQPFYVLRGSRTKNTNETPSGPSKSTLRQEPELPSAHTPLKPRVLSSTHGTPILVDNVD